MQHNAIENTTGTRYIYFNYCCETYCARPRSLMMISAAFSPITIAVLLVLAPTFSGAILKSANLRPLVPQTFRRSSTTPFCSRGAILHVAMECHVVPTLFRIHCSIALSSSAEYSISLTSLRASVRSDEAALDPSGHVGWPAATSPRYILVRRMISRAFL